MFNRDSLLVSASIILGCLLLGLILSPASVGQSSSSPGGKGASNPQAAPGGKYQVALGFDGKDKQVIVLWNTETGQLWQYYPDLPPAVTVIGANKPGWLPLTQGPPK